MTTITQLLNVKGDHVWTVGPAETVYEAIRFMAEKDVGSLLVMDSGALIGLVSERHYARNIVLKGKTSPRTPVCDIMETDVVCARPGQTIDECMSLMTMHRVRHLPVVENNSVVGIVSIGDLVKSIIDDQKFTIGQLESYISGDRMPH